MEIAIIGHGPSIKNADEDEINAHDLVIKQKQADGPGRCDVIVGSMNQVGRMVNMFNQGLVKNPPWVFIDSRFDRLSTEEIQKGVGPCYASPWLCLEWNRTYRSMRNGGFSMHEAMESKASSDELGHLHMSSGLHALMYAGAIVQPKADVIDLYGYDNVRDGCFTWSVTRGPDWNKYPDHRWDVEQKLAKTLSVVYRFELNFRG